MSETVNRSPSVQIYITYGAAHLPGVYRYLHDPHWHIVDVEWRQAIQPQTERDSELN